MEVAEKERFKVKDKFKVSRTNVGANTKDGDKGKFWGFVEDGGCFGRNGREVNGAPFKDRPDPGSIEETLGRDVCAPGCARDRLDNFGA